MLESDQIKHHSIIGIFILVIISLIALLLGLGSSKKIIKMKIPSIQKIISKVKEPPIKKYEYTPLYESDPVLNFDVMSRLTMI